VKKQLYLIPGTAANSKIFEQIKLPSKQFEFHFLEWMMPESKNETIEHYAARMCKNIKHKNPVLLGVSFGGIIAQEISKIINCEKIILISSVKNKRELPIKFRFIRATKFHHLFLVKSNNTLNRFISLIFKKNTQKRRDLYEEYLTFRDPLYINWAIKQTLEWKQKAALPNTIHLHGDKDIVFPIKYIKDCIRIDKGSHIMILTKSKKINTVLLDYLK